MNIVSCFKNNLRFSYCAIEIYRNKIYQMVE